MIRRRQLLFVLGGSVIAARSLRAQQKAMPVIGFLGATSPGPSAAFLTAFQQGLSKPGLSREKRGDRIPLGGGSL